MVASRLELNLVRLLCRCEAMAAEKRDPDEWRLEKVGNPALPLRAPLPQGSARGQQPDSAAPPAALATPRPVRSATSPAMSALGLGAQLALPP